MSRKAALAYRYAGLSLAGEKEPSWGATMCWWLLLGVIDERVAVAVVTPSSTVERDA